MKLLLIDDDRDLAGLLGEALEKRGHTVALAHDTEQGRHAAARLRPDAVLLDLKMPGASGLALIPQLLALNPLLRIVVLTGYASVATAVEAIKLGAMHYLAKPVSVEEVLKAFTRQEGDPSTPLEETPTLFATERQHILATLARHGQNISAAARELGLHRRTLQRKLEKMR